MPKSAATAGLIAAIRNARQIHPDDEIIRSEQRNVKRSDGIVITSNPGFVAEKPMIGLVFTL
jgi:hypothetical protein